MGKLMYTGYPGKKKTPVVVLMLLILAGCPRERPAVNPQSGAGKDPVFADTISGKIRGFKDESGLSVFLGIPYAKPPVGNLRFAAPSEIGRWEGSKQAVEFGPSCPQLEDIFEPASLLKQSEDCLTLNIWTPGVDGKKRPVIIYIHGGGFINGGTGDPLYNGRYISKRGDIVYASVNYRVGAFGFLYLEDFGSQYAGSGNNAIKDQAMAIRWIKNNIARFGGDPENITLMGESAGSASVFVHMGLPQSKGLFKKAIAESGACNLVRTRGRASAVTAGFMKFAGVRDVEGLRSLTAEQVLEALDKHVNDAGFEADLLYAPVIDGNVIYRDPLVSLNQGGAAGIRLLNGTNRDEYRYWINYSWILKYIPLKIMIHAAPEARKKMKGREDKLFEFYEKNFPKAKMADHTFEFATDLMFQVPHIQASEAQLKHAKVWMYSFQWRSQVKEYLGACHAIELPFVLKTFDSPTRHQIVGPEPPLGLSDAIQDAWIRFARTGDPNTPSLPRWPSYDLKTRATMIFNTESAVENDPEKNVRLFFKEIL